MPSQLLSINMNTVASAECTANNDNVSDVFKIWRIFANSGDSLENGRRFENLSWRVWNKASLCNDDSLTIPEFKKTAENTITSSTAFQMPALSTSVESLASVPESETSQISTRPTLKRCHSSERREKHPSPVQLVRLMDKVASQNNDIQSWVQKTEISSAQSSYASTTTSIISETESEVSDTIPSSMESQADIVVRGFTPEKTVSFVRPTPVVEEKKSMFMVGPESYSSNSTTSSYSDNSSALTSGLKKQTSFSQQVVSRQYEADETTDDEILSESAIEDDDSDWEDSDTEASSSYDPKLFTRVPVTRNASTRSLLTTVLAQPNRARSQPNLIQRNGPSLPSSPSQYAPITSKATVATSTVVALSPTTTRMNMLATEFTESLRCNLLLERQQKSKTAVAALKRRHTSQDVPSLANGCKKVDEVTPFKDNTKNISWTYTTTFQDYYTNGW